MMINNIKDDGNKRYSIFNENGENDNEFPNEKDKKNSKDNTSSHENVYKNMNDLDKDKNTSKQEEQEFRPECSRQSDQTQTTLDKNYILSKIIKQPISVINKNFLDGKICLRLTFSSFRYLDDISYIGCLMNFDKI